MSISSISNKFFTYTLSGLGNNTDSIIPLMTKDAVSNFAIVDTYIKNGTTHDVREKAIEEFGTGAVWALGIPALKKIFDKTIYPLFGLNPKLDSRILNNDNILNTVKNSLNSDVTGNLSSQKEIINSLGDKGKLLNKFTLPFSNKQLYKGVFVAKFAASTILAAVALNALIKYKQATTEKNIEKDYYKNNASRILLNGSIKKHNPYSKNKDKNKNISFTSSKLSAFMFNPIKNTAILDGVIAGTRLKDGRKGERKEIALKEIFQIFFIYGIAKPVQHLFENIGNKLNVPIDTDARVIFSKELKENLDNAKNSISSLKNSKNLTKDILSLDPKSSIASLLEQEGLIAFVKDKAKKPVAIDNFKFIDEEKAKKSLDALGKLSDNISNIKKIKGYKTLAVLGNVAFAVWAMGVLQPKLNILMRKKLNNGDNSNPAIKEKEEKMKKNNELYYLNPLKTHQS